MLRGDFFLLRGELPFVVEGGFFKSKGGIIIIIVEPAVKGFAPMDGTNRWSPWTSPATCLSAGERPLASRFRFEVFFSFTGAKHINHCIFSTLYTHRVGWPNSTSTHLIHSFYFWDVLVFMLLPWNAT